MSTSGSSSGAYDLVVVANRLPVDRKVAKDGSTSWQPSPGGLVAALEPVMKRNAGAWVGWTGAAGDTPDPFDAGGIHLVPVPFDETDVEDFYEGMSNATLWPLYHDVIVRPEFHRHWWEAYLRVNRRFAQAAIAQAANGATVWVQDYQLQLVPQMLREERPDLRIGFFNHIPFPPYELFAQLPWRRRVLDGLLGADVLGFQRPADANNFLRACRRNGLPTRRGLVRVAGTGNATGSAEQPGSLGGAPDYTRVGSAPAFREVRAAAFPISVDTESLDALARRPDVQERARQIRRDLGNPRTVLLGVDRLDYTKGILHRLRALEELYQDERLEPGEAVLIQVATPSRERVGQYQQMRNDVEVTVGRINGEFGKIGSPAVHYLHSGHGREEITAMYLAADVLLVTALRDGMNLVAKEYVAARHDHAGALVLSEFAGAAIELPQAFLVNPHDISGLKSTIMDAIEVPPKEAARRMKAMRRRVFENDVAHWAREFLESVGVPSDEGAGERAARNLPVSLRPDGTPRQPRAKGAPRPVAATRERDGKQTRGAVETRDVERDNVTVLSVASGDGTPTRSRATRPARPGMRTTEEHTVLEMPSNEADELRLPAGLRQAMERFARSGSILVALDFDGVLSPIVDEPAAARPLPGVTAVLAELSSVAGVRVALVSGRSLDDLRRVAAPPPEALLVGSHGAQSFDPRDGGSIEPELDDAAAALLAQVISEFEEISSRYPGTHVEVKPAGAVLHTRRASRDDAEAATKEALAGPVAREGVHETIGKEVVEVAVAEVSKGMALRGLRESVEAAAIMYVGDDVTDERAFVVLNDDAGDITVKVGLGETAARHRLGGPADVLAMLRQLLDICRYWPAP